MISRAFSLVFALVSLSGCAQLSPFGEQRTPPELVDAGKALSQNNTALATSQFDALVRSRPRDPAVYARISEFCSQKGKGELAARYAEQGLAATPADEKDAKLQLYLLASTGYEMTGDLDNSVRTAQEAFKLDPENPMTLNGLGYAYAQAGKNLDEAQRMTTKAVEIARKKNVSELGLGMIIDSLGWVYFKQGNLEEALRNLASAADMVPDSWEIHDHLSQVYAAMGNAKDAKIERDRATHMQEAQQQKDG